MAEADTTQIQSAGRKTGKPKNPFLAVALIILALVAAVLAVPRVGVALYPSVARPTISVSCTYPGANAQEVMNTVAGPLEEKINGVEGMSRMTSSCSDSGSYSLSVAFNIGVDRDMALTKVQGKVQQALSLLPQEVKNTGVTVQCGSSEELGIITLRSPGGKLTREQMVDFAYGVVNPAILRVPGVGSSTVKDGKIAMRVWLDANRMAAHGISTEEVVTAVKAQNVQASLGSIGASPTEDPNCRIISLISKGRLDSAEDFEKIIVRTESDGGLVRLGDIARIGRGQQDYNTLALRDDQEAVYIYLVQLPGVDVRKTMNAVKSELRKLESTFPGDLVWEMTYDPTLYMDAALSKTAKILVLSFLLALVAAGLGLRSVRATAIVAVASSFPLALAFAALAAAGFFVSLISLYAFVIAAALAVAFAAVTVVRRDSRAVIAASLAIAAAMVPLAMIDGLQGVMYRQFSLVLGVAALGSALMSLVVIPAFAGGDGLSTRSSQTNLTGFSALVFAAFGIIAWGIGSGLPKEFIPDEDNGLVIVDCKMPEGTSKPVTAAAMKRIYDKVKGIPGLAHAATLIGESIVSGSGENNAKAYISLTDWSERDRTTAEIARDMEKALEDVTEAQTYVICRPPMPGQGSQRGLCVLIYSTEDANPVRFANESQKFLAALQRSPLAESANCGTIADVPHLRVHVDREKCELMKVSMLSLYTALQHALGSVYVNDVNLGTQVNRVTVMADWDGRSTTDKIADLYVRSSTGDMVPVDTLATFSEELGVRDCYRCNQYLYCTAQFLPKPGVAASEAIAEVKRISAEALPRGYVQDWSGLIYEQFQSRGDTPLLIGLAILAVYLVLMVHFGSFAKPFAGLLATAAAALGAVLLHGATGIPLSLYSQFAVLLLIVLCTALPLLGKGALPTLVLAAAALPLVFATGPASVGSRSLGITLAGGFLLFSLVLAIRRGLRDMV